jgi:hypothetical protein
MMPIHASRTSTLLLALLSLGATTAAAAAAANQAPNAPAAPPPPPPARAVRPAATAKPYAMTVTREDGFVNVALVAHQARVGDIARDLAAQLGTRIEVGPGLAQELVTADLPASPLESVLQAIAPRVLVDYELRQAARPLPIAIYLLGPIDGAPKANVRGKDGVSHGVVISGHTEETPTDDGKDPVTVSGDAQRLSIAAKNQPLSLVAMIVADTLGVTLDMDYPAGELVLVDVADLPAEDAVLSISPNLRLHVRVDLSAAERTPLKLVVAQPRARAAR